MAKSAWIPLGIGGIASVLIISGIQGESLSEVLKGEFGRGTKHPSPNPAFKGKSGEATTQSESETTTVSNQAAPANSYPGGPVAPSPLNTFPMPNISSSSKKKRCEELKYGLTVALQYKGQLESLISSGRLNQQLGAQQFHNKYPWYSTWAQEARLCA
jgi:hypothetical protein